MLSLLLIALAVAAWRALLALRALLRLWRAIPRSNADFAID